MPRTALGLDVGGANLKAAHSDGTTCSRPFALWKNPRDLPGALRDLLRERPRFDVVAVTMTGELCDCFDTKRLGVLAILAAVQAVAAPIPVQVWLTDGRLVDIHAARATPLLAAASNWLALATWAGRFAPRGPALLIDIGSTTTDIVPLLDGVPVPRGRTDTERLRCGELVYTGVMRTPLCAVLGGSAMAEFFATTRDVYLMLGRLPEDPSDRDTADGRPATRACAEARVARMIGADPETSTADERREVAEQVVLRQVTHIGGAIEGVAGSLPRPPETIITCGTGEFLAELALKKTVPSCPIVSLRRQLGPEVSKAACAYALAVLAAEAKS
jgi:probable H4MPT-linked C1 transfer pathway protein